MKRIFLLCSTNVAVLALLYLLLFALERAFDVRISGSGTAPLLLFSAVFGFGGALISLALSKWIAKRTLGVRVIDLTGSEPEAWLCATVLRFARQAGIENPEVGIYESEEINAFATGPSRNCALVAVSSGLLRALSRPQIEAVLGHELSHVANGDMVTLTLLQGVLNTFVIFLARIIGSVVDKMVFKNDREESGLGFLLATMAAQIVLGVFASMIVCWFSRYREFRADRGGASLAGTDNMIGALEALQRQSADALPPPLLAFGIRSKTASGLMQLLMSHPPLGQRVAALRASRPLGGST
jgi:heat shock protein HtpX